ncbi:MAG: hypothetical protein ABII79_11040 [bacterium]
MLLIGCIIGSTYYKSFLIRGSPFYPDPDVDFDSFSASIIIVAGISRKPVTDSSYYMHFRVTPAEVTEEENLRFLENLSLLGFSVEFVGSDQVLPELPVLEDTISTCGSLTSNHCRYFRFGRHVIPTAVDTISVYLSVQYTDSIGDVQVADTVVNMWRSDAKHTGVIDH